MKTENPQIDRAALTALLAAQYGASTAPVVFAPVGGDSWCFRAADLWVSVRRDQQGHVPAAYEAAAELREHGLNCVLAPLRGTDGLVVHQLDDYPVVVAPYVPGTPVYATTAPEVAAFAVLLTQLHAATVRTPLPHEEYAFPFQEELEQALSMAQSHDPQTEPYSQPTQRLIRAHRAYLESMQAEARRLARYCRRHSGLPVLTHGEPNGNVLQTDEGRLLLCDWGTTALGPPERDWWDLASHSERITRRPAFVRFYQLRWILGEVAEYTWRFMQPHVGDREDAAMWEELGQYLPPRTEHEA